jgi:hypothetical protein
MRRTMIVLLALTAATLIGACCLPGPVTSLPVTLHPQETGMWCWAASGQMVMHYLGNNVAQCDQANNRFGRTDCCNIDLCPPPTEPAPAWPNPCNCVCGGWPEFDKYGFTFDRTSNAPLSWGDLKEQLSDASYCKSKPFAFSWHWPGGGGHMMVVKGYVELAVGRFVVMLDPWSPCVGDERIITYDYYVESTGHHTHWDDYYNVTRR